MTKKYITLTRKVLEYFKDRHGVEAYGGYHYEEMRISPDNILFFSQQDNDGTSYCTRIFLLNGTEILVREGLNKVENLIDKYYKDKEKENVDKIVISKDDIVKNFIFKNLG